MTDIIPYDFGRAQRESARKLGVLLGVVDAQRLALESDPVAAMREISRLHKQIAVAKRR